MSLSNLLFGKSIYDFNIEDLKNFFSVEQEETSLLEFKSGSVSLEEVHRQVSAFLNTEGGILILGSPIEKSISKNKKVCIGELVPTNISSQDVLMRSIASNISPSPNGLKVKKLEYSSGNVYVLEIPQSLTPPHQVNNEGRYYIRLDREAKPAPHGLVQAMFFKRQYPEIDVEFSILHADNPNDLITVEIHFSNKNHLTAEQVGYIVEIGGVKNIVSAEKVHSQVKLNNGFLHTHGNFKDQILVKGLRTVLPFDIKRAGPVLFIHVEYYCKDSTLERKCCLYDFLTRQYLCFFRSKSPENAMQADDILTLFLQRMNLPFPDVNRSWMISDSLKNK